MVRSRYTISVSKSAKNSTIIVVHKPRMEDKKMNNLQKRKETQKSFTEVMDMMRQNTKLMDFAERNYQLDTVRIELLQNILLEIGERNKEEVKKNIYLYGSMIKGQDFIARQIFLWLLEIIEERR